MVCFVWLNNNVLEGCVCVFVWNEGFVPWQTMGKGRIEATDGDNRVATGVLNCAHTNIEIISFGVHL